MDRTDWRSILSDGNKFKLMPESMEQVAILGLELKEENFPPLDLPSQSRFALFPAGPDVKPAPLGPDKQDKAMSLVWNNAEFDLNDAKFTLYLIMPNP